MAKLKILVVDDDKEIAELVQIHLESEGYQVITAHDAVTGLNILSKEKDISLAVVDIMMPGMNGLTMCDKIREKSPIPIIILSAKSTDLDKIVGLGKGADDYVTKPFNPLELTARVKSQLRRYTLLNPNAGLENTDNSKMIVAGPLTMCKDTHMVTSYDKEIKLTPIEFDILYLMVSNAGHVFSTDEIFERVWNEKTFEANNTVMVHIRRIREKIEIGGARIIETVWGVGYKIEK
ncbi:MAG: response regulator transcription factor [Lachnospiraceae bacterium]|nr:response regulator transcription factor [Lachnospiraceae bacterium]